MHNFHAIEVEAEMRRQEWTRAAAADARAGLAVAGGRSRRRLELPRVSIGRLRMPPAPRESIADSLAPRGPWPVTS